MRMDYEKICRICGNYHTELMPIFKNEGIEHGLPQKIRQHFYTVKISESDDIPAQICYQCVSALVSWHDLFELCEEVNRKFLCSEVRRKDPSPENVLDLDVDHQILSKEDEIPDIKRDSESNLIFDLKMEDPNVMFVSIDNVKVDDEFLFETSPARNHGDDLTVVGNGIHEHPVDSIDMECNSDDGDLKDDDLLSLDGNPPSVTLDPYGNMIDDLDEFERKSPILNDKTTEKSEKALPKKYTTETIQLALAEVQRDEEPLSVKKAAYKYNIPLSTLNDKFNGKSPPVAMRKGRLSVLGHEIEQQLVQWILQCHNEGFPLYRDGLFYSVRKFVTDNPSFNSEDCPFKNGQPTTKWFFGFLRRHPSISSTFFQSRKRIRLSTPMIRKWFSHLKKTVDEEILKQPDRLWTIEVKSSLVDQKDKKVFIDGTSCFHLMNSQTERETVTAVISANAAAAFGPRMVVFKEGEEPFDSAPTSQTWSQTTSICGCAGAEAIYQYFSSQFLPFLKASSITFPIVVFFDSKHARISLQLMELCRNNRIKLVCFLPGSSSWFHPVDLMPPSVERQWKKVNKDDIPRLLDTLMTDKEFIESVRNGFKNCGLYPFNPYNVTVPNPCISEFEKRKVKSESIVGESFYEWLERQIPSNLLSQFQTCYGEQTSWHGEEIHKTAFELWTRSFESEQARENAYVDRPFYSYSRSRLTKKSRYHLSNKGNKVVEREPSVREPFSKWLERHISASLLEKFYACYQEGNIWKEEEIHKTAYEMWVKNYERKMVHENSFDDHKSYLFSSSSVKMNSTDYCDEENLVSGAFAIEKSFCEWLDQQISPDLLKKFQECHRCGEDWNGDEIHSTAYQMWARNFECRPNYVNPFQDCLDGPLAEVKSTGEKAAVRQLFYLYEWLKQQISPALLDEFQICYQKEKVWNGELIHKTAFDMWAALQSKLACENYSMELDEVWLEHKVYTEREN